MLFADTDGEGFPLAKTIGQSALVRLPAGCKLGGYRIYKKSWPRRTGHNGEVASNLAQSRSSAFVGYTAFCQYLCRGFNSDLHISPGKLIAKILT